MSSPNHHNNLISTVSVGKIYNDLSPKTNQPTSYGTSTSVNIPKTPAPAAEQPPSDRAFKRKKILKEGPSELDAGNLVKTPSYGISTSVDIPTTPVAEHPSEPAFERKNFLEGILSEINAERLVKTTSSGLPTSAGISTTQVPSVDIPSVRALERRKLLEGILTEVKLGRFVDTTHRCFLCGAWKRKTIRFRKILGLIFMFILFVSTGAIIFNKIESTPERERKQEFTEHFNTFLAENPGVNRTALHELMSMTILHSQIGVNLVNNSTDVDRWAFINSFGFVVALITTIGYGTLSPYTNTGKMVSVVYALVGIPLTLIVLSTIGQKMGEWYSKIRESRFALLNLSIEMNTRLNILIVTVIGILIIFVLPSLVFSTIEEWSYMEALYFCFTTLSTIGFGDYVIGFNENNLKDKGDLHQVYVFFAYIWVIVGLSYLSLCYSVIMESVVASARHVSRRTKKRLAGVDRQRRNANVARIKRDYGEKSTISIIADNSISNTIATRNEILKSHDSSKDINQSPSTAADERQMRR